MTERTTTPPGPAIAPPRLFPPLGNPGFCTVAAARVETDPGFATATRWATDRPLGPCHPLPPDLEAWLGAAVRAANDGAYRFELRGLDADGPAGLVDLAGDHGADGVAAAGGRGTAKLLAVLALEGPGQVELTAAGLAQSTTIDPGTLVIWPAFLCIQVAERRPGSLRALVTTAHGPAFR